MFNKRKLICAALGMFMFAQLQAQVSFGGSPRFSTEKSIASESVVSLETIDNDVYLAEDINLSGKGSAMRVGVIQKTNLSNKTHGTVEVLDNGDRIWRLTIRSNGATFMFPSFKTFDIPAGAELFVYDASREFVIGKFTAESALPEGNFYTQSIPGEEITIEYYEPYEVVGLGTLVIDEVGHGYKDLFNMMENNTKAPHGASEGNCHINVVCEEGDNFRDQIRSVVCYEIVVGNYVYMCSGALINNTRNDKTNYVLSAYHCQDVGGTITRFVFYFNYQTHACNGISGQSSNSVVGADIVAKNSASDFMLMKLKNRIPDSYKVYYAGWSRSGANPSVGACIHHPGGDWKKISIPRSVQSAAASGSEANFWNVKWYSGDDNKGVTEQGSSGSALFNAQGLIVGQLYAGASGCEYLYQNTGNLFDYYGKLSKSWTGGGSANRRLSDWLDPDGTNVESLQGINWDYSADSVGINAAVEQNKMSVYPNPSNGVFNVDIDEIGMANYYIYDMMGRCVQTAAIMLNSNSYQLKAEGLQEGTYILEIQVNGKKYTKTIVLK